MRPGIADRSNGSAGGAAGRALAVALLFFLLLAVVTPAGAADGARWFFEASFRDRGDLLRLSAAGLDVAGINWRTMQVGVIAGPGELDALDRLGFAYRLLAAREPEAAVPADLANYTDPAELEAFLDQVEAQHPTLARKVLLADGLPEGHTVWALKITRDVGEEHDRPAFILDAQHHAREVMTVEIARDMIDYLTSRYDTDPKVKEWVDNIVIWVVPCVNPDGAAYVFSTDEWWRKNRSHACSPSSSWWGVDLNRNYPWGWNLCPGGSSGSCYDEDYRGPSAASEMETQGMTSLMNGARAPSALTYHSYGELLLYPLGCGGSNERGALNDLAQTLSAVLQNDDGQTGQYTVGPSYELYPTDGTSDDTEYGRYGTTTFAIEVNNYGLFQPDYATWRDITVQRQRTAWQFFLDRTLDTPSIQGHVTDAETGLPLPAEVDLQEVVFTHGEEPRRAADNGRYFRLARAGRFYHATFSYPGYHPRTFEVSMGQGAVRLDIALSTHPYLISRITPRFNPYRLIVRGAGFHDGCQVKIDGVAAPSTAFLGANRLVARGGKALRALLPKGVPVAVTVEDGTGGVSGPFSYIR